MAAYTVNTLGDETYGGGDLASETSDGNGLSLREALGLANATVDQDEITFEAGLSGGTLTLTQGELGISSDVVIDGDLSGDGGAPEITLDANDTSRVINITAGASTLSGLVIAGGHTDSRGGGIWNSGTLTLTGTTVSDNYAGTWGGGVHNDGTATLTNTTVSGNSIGDGAAGGGIANFGTATLTNTTVAGNSVDLGTGGGIHNRGTATLTSTTVSGNSVDLYSYLGAGSGIDNSYGTATLTNTIVLGNAPTVPNNSEILGTITRAGPNMIGGSAADVFAETVDNDGVDAGLLADNGGAVQTIALKNDASNPALDAGLDDRLDETIVGIDLNGDGDTDDVIDTDARGNGFDRIVEQTGITARNQIDLGAVEFQQIVSPPGPQEVASLMVTTAADVLDRFDGETSLREALALANDPLAGSLGDGDGDNDGGPTDTITFAADLSGETITLVSGELVIGSDVAIDGDVSGDGGEPEITLDANGASRVIRIASGSSTLDGLVMTGGTTFDPSSGGGGVFVAIGATVAIVNSAISGNDARSFKNSSNLGGGISNEGTVTLTNTTVSGNGSGGIVNDGTLMLSNSTVSGNASAGYGSGGGISTRVNGTTTLINTTVSDNSSLGIFGDGGGISGPASLINSTVSGNSAFRGGGISGSATLINSTVSGNDALYDGGISGLATLTNSIVLGNSASIENAEISGTITETGPNLIGGNAVDVFAETVDNNGVEAGLLGDNGGAVKTIALKNDASNPALDAGRDDRLDESVVGVDLNGDGDMDDVIGTDARGAGFDRLVDLPGVANNGDNTVDLGAFEVQVQSEGIIGTPGHDTLTGTEINDVMMGLGGNDVLYGEGGDDTLDGGDGNDHLNGGMGNDALEGGAGHDSLYGREGNDALRGNGGNDVLSGAWGDDTLEGGDGEDDLRGWDGNDVLYGDGGDDTLDGGDGNDHLNGGMGNDALEGGAGHDSLYGREGNDVLRGNGGNDVLSGAWGDDTLEGGDGEDDLRGWDGNDVLYGDGGDDTLDGGAGNDHLNGGMGNDALEGGDGRDGLYGREGNDALRGNGGNDDLSGAWGDDTLEGGDGDDDLRGWDGNDVLYGEGGDDTLDGGDGNDHLNGGMGNDALEGGAGHDSLYGREGNDVLRGNGGNDVLSGAWGDDTLEGGPGRDSFRFNGTDCDRDTITDFSLIEDTLIFEGVGSADDPDDLTYAVGDFDGDGAQDDIRITFSGLGDDLADERIDVLDVGSDIEALKTDMMFV